MPSPELLSEIRQLVVEDRIQDAFKQLRPVLEKERSSFPQAYRTLLSLKGEWASQSKDNQLGIISKEQATLAENRIRNRFLELLDQVEKGPEKAAGVRRSPYLWLAAATILVVLIWLAIHFLGQDDNTLAASCPAPPANSEFSILLHPFSTLKTEEEQVLPHKAILSRLDALNSKYELSTAPMEVVTSYNPFLSSSAQEIAGECGGQLVIWGSYEKLDEEQFVINTQFQFFNSSGKIDMTKADWDFERMELDMGKAGTTLSTYGSVFDTLTNLTSIISGEQDITRQIEQTLLYLFGIIAHQSDHPDVAAETLTQSAAALDSANQLLRTMSLADSYFQLEMIDESIEVYDSVLSIHPDYPLAINNRAYLNIKQGNLNDALIDLDKKIRMNPNDTLALMARFEVHLNNKQIREAEKDVDMLNRVTPNTPRVVNLRDRVNKAKSRIRQD